LRKKRKKGKHRIKVNSAKPNNPRMKAITMKMMIATMAIARALS
jgi:hypothetical protein